jgi:hypothetical protein
MVGSRLPCARWRSPRLQVKELAILGETIAPLDSNQRPGG